MDKTKREHQEDVAPEELERQEADLLPEREAMSLIRPHPGQPPIDELVPPIDDPHPQPD